MPRTTEAVTIRSVLIDRRVLEGFRRRAKKAYPREHLEALLGQIATDGEASVHAMCAIDHKGTRDGCEYETSDLLAIEEEFAQRGLHMIGTIHSHPALNTCVHPSELDHNTGVEHGEFVMGVMHVWKQEGVMHTRVSFSVPRKPLEVKVS